MPFRQLKSFLKILIGVQYKVGINDKEDRAFARSSFFVQNFARMNPLKFILKCDIL